MINKRLFQLLGKNRKYIFLVVSLMVFGLLMNLTITAAICRMFYLLFKNAPWKSYLFPLPVALVAMIIRPISTRITGSLKDRLGRMIKKELREKIYEKALALGMSASEKVGLAGLTQMSLEGIEQLDLYFSVYIPQFFFSLIAPLVLFLVTVGIEWRVALILLFCVPLIPLSIVAVSKYAKRIFAKYWGKYISMGGEFLDSLQGLKELKIFQADEAQQIKINQSAESFRKITMRVLVMQLASTTIMDSVAYGGAGLGIVVGLISILQWGLNPFYALFITLVAVEFFLPLRAFGSAFHVAMNGISAGEKLLDFLKEEKIEWGNQSFSGNEIELKSLSFSYDGKRKILDNISVSFSSTGMKAIVGESGCGKSTLVKMIAGVITAQSGYLFVGGVERKELSREDFYSHLAVVSYNTYLFNESIRSNFQLANRSIDEKAIYSYLKKVNMDIFVRKNGGLDKIINEDAENLSGGQRQRIALAVNLAADKSIYIFDEATSNIDIESEAIIMKNIEILSKTKNVILISHRLANVVNADTIYYMQRGVIKEQGTHQTLIEKRGGYQKLYEKQKSLEEGFREAQK